MTEEPVAVLLDEHVSRVFQRVLHERGYDVEHAKDRFGEHTVDEELLRWAGEHGVLFCTHDAADFSQLHRRVDHAGLLLYRDQDLPYDDPEALASAVDAVVAQYGRDELADSVAELDEWVRWSDR